ncbi:MAG: undecaprenyldiphospho-muramoylpentapeptide beta-N-acetylglucosaminyltransferase [Pseudomonadota bacterium]
MRIIISGGGTGGHLFPGVALAEEFQARDSKHWIIFVGTKKGIEQRIIPAMGYELKFISGTALLGSGPFQKLLGIVQFLIGLLQAIILIRTIKPDLVVGTGGYVSAPVILAAYLLGIKTAICEQNSVPGLTNRMLGRLVKNVFIAFEESCHFFPQEKTLLTGNPVRKEFLNTLHQQKKDRSNFCLLILGGSQGAHSINRAMVEALDTLTPHKDKLAIIHQTGFQDFSWVKDAYREKLFQAEVSPFITGIASAYVCADLVISRAGALTITELLVCGKPSVLIPYPYAAYNHQEINAKTLVDQGAAHIILDKDLDRVKLGETILYFFHRPQELDVMGKKAQTLAQPEAAKTIVDYYHLQQEREDRL